MTEKTEDLIAEARAERDAALAAIERVRALLQPTLGGTPTGEPADVCGCGKDYFPCEHAAMILAALDGAPEPEWEEHINYGAERTDGSVAYEPRGRNYATHQQVARFGPWEPLPVGGEN